MNRKKVDETKQFFNKLYKLFEYYIKNINKSVITMKLTIRTGYASQRGEAIHEGDGFKYVAANWIHLGRDYKPRKQGFNEIFGGAFYNKEKHEWWVKTDRHPELEKPLKDVKGVIKISEIYRPEK